jgi:hypothetical protein
LILMGKVSVLLITCPFLCPETARLLVNVCEHWGMVSD